MKERHLIFIFLIILSISGRAQIHSDKPLTSSASKAANLGRFSAGVKIGCPWSMMYYFGLRGVIYAGKIGYSGGIALEGRINNKISIGLEGTYALKGTNMYYFQDFEIGYGVYSKSLTRMKSTYKSARVRMPIFYNLAPISGYQPYIFAGPEFEHQREEGAEYIITKAIYNENTHQMEKPFVNNKIKMETSNNASIVLGGGVKTKINTEHSSFTVKLEAALCLGCLTFDGRNSSIVTFNNAEVNATIIFPIKKRLQGACIKWGKYF